MIIYKATNIVNNKVYIGQTTQTFEKRRQQHEKSINYKSSKCRVFAKAIKKYGVENFKWEIIDTANTLEELNEKETYWILKLDTIVDNGKGYNLNTGGSNPCHSEETKRLIGAAQIGEKNHMYGVKGKDNPTSRPVLNITDNVAYENATQCSEIEGVLLSKVCAVCRGDRATTNNKIYRYIDENGNIIEPVVKMKKKSKRVANIDTGEIFEQIKDVEKIVNKSSCNLATKLREGNGSCWWSGYRWKYESVTEDVSPTRKVQSRGKKVKNLTTGVVYDSISMAGEAIGKNYRNLATALRKGNGKCFWNKFEWEVIQ